VVTSTGFAIAPAPAAVSPLYRRRFQVQSRRDTAPELAVRRAVWRLGLRYAVDASLPLPGVRRRADMVFSRARIAVFVDGCYWHGCPRHCRPTGRNRPWWVAKLSGNAMRDVDTDSRLRREGWIPVRVWEHDDPIEAAQRVADTVRARLWKESVE
jgi:DNA mismatch endonuclease (patch repair protein)